MIKWQLIIKAPRDGTRVLVANGKEVASSEFTNDRWVLSPTAWDGEGEYGGLANLPFEPTHFMPLPEPPK